MEESRKQQEASQPQPTQTQSNTSGQASQKQNEDTGHPDQNSQDGSHWNNYQTRELGGPNRGGEQSDRSNI